MAVCNSGCDKRRFCLIFYIWFCFSSAQTQWKSGSKYPLGSMPSGTSQTALVCWMENIRPPPETGSTFFNYKHTFSIVLMALVDSNYRFLYVDVGCNGRISDGGVFGGCSLQEALEKRTLNIPAPSLLPESDQLAPYCFVAD